MKKSIMIQGTASGVGKSLITAGLCRIFFKDGFKVAPFKSQNMALNSFVTKEGLEMGRAQVIQAEASNVEPNVKMNPILLKPTSDKKSQVIIEGKVYKNMNAKDYFEFKPKLKERVEEIFSQLQNDFEIVVIEGAGSPAEINLKKDDIVNMGMAKISNSNVILVADIDRGGVFASIYGTLMLLEEDERNLVKGVIINKFRGDKNILEPGIKMLEELIKIPVLGVVPYFKIDIEDEDSLSDKFDKKFIKKEINIGIIKLSKISNFTDFDPFNQHEDVNLIYVDEKTSFEELDFIIIPGSKSTIKDLIEIKNNGLAQKIIRFAREGKPVFGICGGYQMLGEKILDPDNVESKVKEVAGLNLLPMTTIFEGDKKTSQSFGKIKKTNNFYLKNLKDVSLKGYEIHMGRSLDNLNTWIEGIDSLENKNVFGTYLHGIFDNYNFTRGFLNQIRKEKGLDDIDLIGIDFNKYKQIQYDLLENHLREHLNLEFIYKILRGE